MLMEGMMGEPEQPIEVMGTLQPLPTTPKLDEHEEVAVPIEVSVAPPEVMKVEWHPTDPNPVPTDHPVRLIRCYAKESGRQLKVMQTADAEDCLHIYLDVV